jgi:hypothetical protein
MSTRVTSPHHRHVPAEGRTASEQVRSVQRWSCTHYTCETHIAYRAKYPQYGDMVDNIKGYDGLFSIEKARKLLGYEPEWTWRKGNVEPTNDGNPPPKFPF